MSQLYETDLGTVIGTASVGPVIDGVRLQKFTWHINPLDFYKIAQNDPFINGMIFDDFIAFVSKRQIQEIDIHE